MSKGSHNSWGADDVKHCAVCEKRVTLKMPSWAGSRRDGSRFVLCREHFGHYGQVYRAR